MTWKTNWRGDIDKVLDASNVLNIDHLFDEEGESHATQYSGINNTDNSIYITYMYTSEGKSIGKIKSTKKNTLAFISKSSNDDVDLLELRKNNYKALNQSNDPFKDLLKYGHFYDLKSINDFYIDYNSYFIATKIDKYEVQYIKNLKLNDRPFQTNKLFAECISNLIAQNGIIRPSKSIPKSSHDLLSNLI